VAPLRYSDSKLVLHKNHRNILEHYDLVVDVVDDRVDDFVVDDEGSNAFWLQDP